MRATSRRSGCNTCACTANQALRGVSREVGAMSVPRDV